MFTLDEERELELVVEEGVDVYGVKGGKSLSEAEGAPRGRGAVLGGWGR